VFGTSGAEELGAVAAGGSRGGRARTESAARRSSPVTRAGPPRRSPARATALIVGGVLVAVAVLVAILYSIGGGGSGTTSATTAGSTAGANTGTAHSGSHARRASGGNRAETSVAVLNGTETAGLAHKISSNLRQSGYTRATALNGRPSGANQVTVVEYAGGHLQDAQGVARSLGVTRVQPMESSTASLAGSAGVAVIVGVDKAATGP
jgi:hypothetical protein